MSIYQNKMKKFTSILKDEMKPQQVDQQMLKTDYIQQDYMSPNCKKKKQSDETKKQDDIIKNLKSRMSAILRTNDYIYQSSQKVDQDTDEQIFGQLDIIRDQIYSVKSQLNDIQEESHYGLAMYSNSRLSSSTKYLSRNNSIRQSLQFIKKRHNSNYQHSQDSSQINLQMSSIQTKIKNKEDHLVKFRPSIKQSLTFSHLFNVSLQRVQIKETSLQNIQESQYYLFCYFSRLYKSIHMQLINKNSIQVNIQNKLGECMKHKKITLQNEIITSIQGLSDVKSKFYLIIGCKSSGKWNILKRLTNQLCSSHQSRQKIKLHYQILGSIQNQDKRFRESISNQVDGLGQINSYTIDINENIELSLNQFWQKVKSDPYFVVKKFLMAQKQMNLTNREPLMSLLQNNLKCLKILCIEQYSDQGQKLSWIICNNKIPNKTLDWQSYALIKDENQLFSKAADQNFLNKAKQVIKSHELKTILTINPLKFRLNESLKILNSIGYLNHPN